MLFKQSRQRVTTGQLEPDAEGSRCSERRRRCSRAAASKIYYATQVKPQPPTIVLFCNDPAAISKPYQRYPLSAVREHMHFEEVPIKLYLRRRQASDTRDDTGADEIGPIVDVGEDQGGGTMALQVSARPRVLEALSGRPPEWTHLAAGGSPRCPTGSHTKPAASGRG